MQSAAQHTTDTLLQAGWFTHLTRHSSKDFTDGEARKDPDNPHICASALFVALSISLRYLEDQAIKTPLSDSITSAVEETRQARATIRRLIRRIESLQPEDAPGYVRRWKAISGEQIFDAADWTGQPSLDEYSALLFGLSWVRSHTLPPGAANSEWGIQVRGRIAKLFAAMQGYLRQTDGFLIRPHGSGFVTRGSLLGFCIAPLEAVLGDISPLPPFPLSPTVRFAIETTRSQFESLKDFPHLIEELHKDFDIYVALAVASDFAELGALPINALLAVVAPLLALVASGVTLTTTTTNEEIWRIASSGYASSVVPKGFLVPIFDRFSLAATSSPTLAESWLARSKRPRDLDWTGWQILAEACRVWFGSEEVSAEALHSTLMGSLQELLPELAQTPPGQPTAGLDIKAEHQEVLRRIEGFICGWSVLCLALDLSPGISWRMIQFTDIPAHPDDWPRDLILASGRGRYEFSLLSVDILSTFVDKQSEAANFLIVALPLFHGPTSVIAFPAVRDSGSMTTANDGNVQAGDTLVLNRTVSPDAALDANAFLVLMMMWSDIPPDLSAFDAALGSFVAEAPLPVESRQEWTERLRTHLQSSVVDVDDSGDDHREQSFGVAARLFEWVPWDESRVERFEDSGFTSFEMSGFSAGSEYLFRGEARVHGLTARPDVDDS